ncbi:MAG: SIR2 family protein [Methylococcaceae bacterium]
MKGFTHKGLSIDDITNDLRSSLHNGRLVVFIGAGISRSQDYPSWTDLTESMINDCDLDHNVKKDLSIYLGKRKYEAIAELIKQNSGTFYKSFLQQKFKPPGNTIGVLYKAIAQIPFHSFITTNYDRSLELSLGSTDNDINSRMADYSFDWRNIQQIQETIKYSYRHIFHAHGMWDDSEQTSAESIILAESDYKELRRSALYKEYLAYIFKKFTVLFLGFGMQDWEIEWIDNLISEQIGSTNNLMF